MASLSKTTSDHDEIRRWAEERGGKPAHVKNTGSSEDIGILRIDFPGYSGEGSLEAISWEDFFEKFDERGLSLLFQEETAAGERSNFNKIVSAETAEEVESGSRRSGKKVAGAKKTRQPAKKSVAKKSAKKAASKSSAKKTAARKKTGSMAAARKAAAKKSPAKKTAAKKSSVKKSSAGKTAAKRRR